LALAFDTASAFRNVPLDLGKVLFEHIALHAPTTAEARKRSFAIQNVPSIARVAAGAFGFLTLIQVLDGPLSASVAGNEARINRLLTLSVWYRPRLGGQHGVVDVTFIYSGKSPNTPPIKPTRRAQSATKTLSHGHQIRAASHGSMWDNGDRRLFRL
jgi:hypothetical protein